MIILTILARIVIRLRSPQPLPEGMTETWNIWLPRATQWAIYAALLLIGSSGLDTLALNNMPPFTVEMAALDRTVPTLRGNVLRRKKAVR